MTDANGKFKPEEHLIELQGKAYLQVAFRIQWFRSEHPNAILDTQMVEHDAQQGRCLFKAYAAIPEAGSATGWGSETESDFRDYIEKAETKAIGRALAALGFGTQFCLDFDEGGAVTDAPIAAPVQKTSTRSKGGEKEMPLKFAGQCTDCGYRMAQGTIALYDGSTKTVRHRMGECPQGEPAYAHPD